MAPASVLYTEVELGRRLTEITGVAVHHLYPNLDPTKGRQVEMFAVTSASDGGVKASVRFGLGKLPQLSLSQLYAVADAMRLEIYAEGETAQGEPLRYVLLPTATLGENHGVLPVTVDGGGGHPLLKLQNEVIAANVAVRMIPLLSDSTQRLSQHELWIAGEVGALAKLLESLPGVEARLPLQADASATKTRHRPNSANTTWKFEQVSVRTVIRLLQRELGVAFITPPNNGWRDPWKFEFLSPEGGFPEFTLGTLRAALRARGNGVYRPSIGGAKDEKPVQIITITGSTEWLSVPIYVHELCELTVPEAFDRVWRIIEWRSSRGAEDAADLRGLQVLPVPGEEKLVLAGPGIWVERVGESLRSCDRSDTPHVDIVKVRGVDAEKLVAALRPLFRHSGLKVTLVGHSPTQSVLLRTESQDVRVRRVILSALRDIEGALVPQQHPSSIQLVPVSDTPLRPIEPGQLLVQSALREMQRQSGVRFVIPDRRAEFAADRTVQVYDEIESPTAEVLKVILEVNGYEFGDKHTVGGVEFIVVDHVTWRAPPEVRDGPIVDSLWPAAPSGASVPGDVPSAGVEKSKEPEKTPQGESNGGR